MGAGKSRQAKSGVKQPLQMQIQQPYSGSQVPFPGATGYTNSQVPYQTQQPYPQQQQQQQQQPGMYPMPSTMQPNLILPQSCGPMYSPFGQQQGQGYYPGGHQFGPAPIRSLMHGYAANTESRRNNAITESSEHDEFLKCYPPQQQQQQKYRNH